MASTNLLNVYHGPNAVQQYFDPERHPPLPLVEIPQKLNPYYNDGVRIFAKMMSTHPANNVKIMPGQFQSSSFRVVFCSPKNSDEHAEQRGGATQDEDCDRILIGFHGYLIGVNLSYLSWHS
jgi:hypothetical protein